MARIEPAPTSHMLGEIAKLERTRPIFLTANESPGAYRSAPFPFVGDRLLSEAATKLAYTFNSAPSGTSPSCR